MPVIKEFVSARENVSKMIIYHDLTTKKVWWDVSYVRSKFVVTQKFEEDMKMDMQNMMHINNSLRFGNEFDMS